MEQRGINFRAWDNVTQKMYKVVSLHWRCDYRDDINPFDKIVIDADGFENRDHTQVEITQSTGVFDKNGKEIYEGDILEYIAPGNGFRATYLVWYDVGAFRIRTNYAFDSGYILGTFKGRAYEVIGNKFENLEKWKQYSDKQ